MHNFLLIKCEIILDYPIDCYVSKDCFEIKLLGNAKPMNESCVGLRHGLIEILEACANSFCQKVGKKQGVRVIKDLISESVIELFREIYEKHEFSKGLSTMKILKKLTLEQNLHQ